LSRKRLLAALALAAITAALLPVSPAQAATTYTVEVGGDAGKAFSWRFYPSAIKVAEGDTIQFNAMVDLTAAGESAEEWREKYAGDVDDPYYLWQSDEDDSSEKLNLGVLWEFVGPPCGTTDAPCSYTGDEIHNGLPFLSEDPGFSVVVNAAPGTVFYAVNLFGGQSHMRIQVVEPGEASTQAELDARSAELKERDTALAGALFNSLNNPEKHKEDGKVVWDAYAGYDTRNLSFFVNFPRKMKVNKGDKVRYHFELENELHSASSFTPKAFEVFEQSFLPVCDPDGDEGPGPDNESLPEPPFCEDPSQLEVDFHELFFGQAGNGRHTSANDFESSGIRTPESLQGGGFGDGKYWDVRMDKPNTEKGWKFICLFHGPQMNNRILVRR
jgi:plastocyanin